MILTSAVPPGLALLRPLYAYNYTRSLFTVRARLTYCDPGSFRLALRNPFRDASRAALHLPAAL